MATYLQLLSVLLVLSICSDVLHMKSVWFDGGQENGCSLVNVKYSMLIPGAVSILSRSAIKAAKKLAKALAKKRGKNKQKGKGQSIF